MSTLKDFDGHTPTWCPGCGDWGIGISIKQAFVQMGLDPSDLFMVFDIGCSGNMNDVLNAYAMHGLHGRALATALGIKLAHHTMPVAVVGGDGGLYGEGGNHFIHACRGNHDVNVIVHDNNVYGLTTGQVAPTALKGQKSKSTPSGIIEIPINPLSLAIASGATFVAQAFAGDTKQLVELLKRAFAHKGFSLVNVLQPCVTFNKYNTYQYYMERTYKLEETYDPTNHTEAMKRAVEPQSEKYPLGVLYETQRPVYHEQVDAGLTDDVPLLKRSRFTDFSAVMKEFA